MFELIIQLALTTQDTFPKNKMNPSTILLLGDAILSLNGISLSDLSTQEVLTLLQQAPANVSLVMSWGTASHTTAKVSDSTAVGMEFRIRLEKSSEGFGFTTRTTYMGNQNKLSSGYCPVWRRHTPFDSALRSGRRRQTDTVLSLLGKF
eukprot:sb/3473651/